MIRLIVPAQQARPGPPLSPVLGQHAIKPADFVTRFNGATTEWTPGVPLRVRLTKGATPAAWGLAVVGVPVAGVLPRVPTRSDLWTLTRADPARGRTLLGTLRSFGSTRVR